VRLYQNDYLGKELRLTGTPSFVEEDSDSERRKIKRARKIIFNIFHTSTPKECDRFCPGKGGVFGGKGGGERGKKIIFFQVREEGTTALARPEIGKRTFRFLLKKKLTRKRGGGKDAVFGKRGYAGERPGIWFFLEGGDSVSMERALAQRTGRGGRGTLLAVFQKRREESWEKSRQPSKRGRELALAEEIFWEREGKGGSSIASVRGFNADWFRGKIAFRGEKGVITSAREKKRKKIHGGGEEKKFTFHVAAELEQGTFFVSKKGTF